MRLATLLGVLLLLSTGILLADQMTGWITDQQCAAAGKFSGAEHKKCVEAGQPIVFVSDADKRIYKISDQDKVKQFIGQKVSLKGSANGDTVEVEEVTGDAGK